MRRFLLIAVVVALCVGVFPTLSLAGKVQVYTVKEENMSSMALRNRALAEGFAHAVADEAQALLGGALDQNRLEAMRQYLVDSAKEYIQGYNILSSEDVEDGLMMTLDVHVNRRTLRDGLTRLGFFETAKTLQPASVTWPGEMTDEELSALQSLMVLSGVEQAVDVYPAVTLEYGPKKGTYKGTLVTEDREWGAAGKSLSMVWTDLWVRYFTRPKDNATSPKGRLLTVSGWFTPDGVLEFDRVLKGWDFAVQDSRLVEMDIQPTGVGATWNMNILDPKRLSTLLNSFLPQRGLSFQLGQEAGS